MRAYRKSDAAHTALGEPPLCIGDDFARTDLPLISLASDEMSADAEQSGEPTP